MTLLKQWYIRESILNTTYEAEFYAVADIEIIEDRFLNIVCNYKFEEGEKQKEEQGKARLLLRHPRDVLILKYISLCHSADVNSYFSVF